MNKPKNLPSGRFGWKEFSSLNPFGSTTEWSGAQPPDTADDGWPPALRFGDASRTPPRLVSAERLELSTNGLKAA